MREEPLWPQNWHAIFLALAGLKWSLLSQVKPNQSFFHFLDLLHQLLSFIDEVLQLLIVHDHSLELAYVSGGQLMLLICG